MNLPKSIYWLAAPILFFILFLHPLYLVTYFETHPFTLGLFRAMSLAASACGVIGIGMYLRNVHHAIRHRHTNQPSLWFQAPLTIACATVIIKFLLPILR